MARMTGKRALMEFLVAQGVRHAFGNPGTSELPFMDAIQDYPQITYILGLQETVVMGAADGYARATGGPAVVNLHISPGLANGMNMLFNAWRGGIPLVVTAGQSDARLLPYEPGLSSNLVEMARQYCKFAIEVTEPAHIPLIMRRAWKVAAAAPTGPVFVSLPVDAMSDEGEMGDIAAAANVFSRAAPDPDGLARAADLLASARQAILVLGDGVHKSGAVAEAVDLAELLGARVYTAGGFGMIFPTTHPQYLGAFNTAAPGVQAALQDSDVVLVVGGAPFLPQRFGAVPPYPAGVKLMQLDANPAEVAKNLPVDVGLVADPRLGMAALAEAVRSRLSGPARRDMAARAEAVRAERAVQREILQAQLETRWDAVPISNARLYRELREALPEDAIVTDEALAGRAAFGAYFDLTQPGTFHGATGWGLGYGMTGPLGVKLAQPGRTVAGIVGDGSAMYAIQALWTAAHYNIPVKYIIVNNASYRILKMNMINYLGEAYNGPRFLGFDLEGPELNYEKLAGAFGIPGRRVTRPQDLRPAIDEALAHPGPAVVDVIVDGSTERPF
ncbi:MAG: thiamine pyrophosphate-binding protein [Chloroflexi bacterium]|nr:thiamine pyrophosphate-binding protein [Chloroflexota bacterium]